MRIKIVSALLILLHYGFLAYLYAATPFESAGILGLSVRSIILLYIAWSSVALMVAIYVCDRRILLPLQSSIEMLNKLGESDPNSTDTNLITAARNCQLAFSELRQREHAIADYSSEVICSLTPNLTFKSLSPSAWTNWGYLPGELAGKQLAEFLLPNELELSVETLKRMRQAATVQSFENRLIKRDKTAIDLLWQVEWSESAGEYFAICTDITARKTLERARQEFAAMINHDLRAPLSSLRINLSMLSNKTIELDSPDAERVLKSSEKSVLRLLSLINELLDLEKSFAGELSLDIDSVDASALIQQAVEEVSGLAQRKSLTFNTEKVPKATFVNADAERTLRVFVNILSNSIKYSPANSSIEMRAEKIENQIQFSIKDSGPGIAPKYQTVIFEPYKQVGSDAKKVGSTGLGLAICKVFVEAQNGRIGVESKEGEGSTFWFTLQAVEP
ncbi:MAG: PAS domain-containing sensor histidine kinase [Candidatus Obscuribacterales bacterium]|nr:PAS domain-containing sensor histidine kinase [Candidatus Obscuribacterales bacterium]